MNIRMNLKTCLHGCHYQSHIGRSINDFIYHRNVRRVCDRIIHRDLDGNGFKGGEMKELKALDQLKMCVDGKCENCAHSNDGCCYDIHDHYIREIAAALIELESYRLLKSGDFMNRPEV